MSLPIGILVIVAAAGAIAAASVYNRLIGSRNAVDNAFATIDVQLKQRCDLVPRVVAAAQGYMRHEREVLERLTALRAHATTDGLDPALRLSLDAQMGRLLAQVFVRAEQYPELKAADTVMMLQRTLNEVEAQIAAARRSYNAAVTGYNTGIQSFPANLATGALGFSRRPLFEATADDERVPAAPSSLIESR